MAPLFLTGSIKNSNNDARTHEQNIPPPTRSETARRHQLLRQPKIETAEDTEKGAAHTL